MTTWAGRTAGADSDISCIRCTAQLCTAYAAQQFVNRDIILCQEHALYVWSTVQGMVDQYGAPTKPAYTRLSRSEAERRFGAVYFITTAGRIKIGFSTDPERRLAQYPPDMEILHVIAGTRKDERRYHLRFADYLRDGREWFEDCTNLRVLIDEAVKGKPGVDFTPPRRRTENTSGLVVVRPE